MRLIDADAVKSSVKTQTEFVRGFGGKLSEIADLMEQGFLQEIENAPPIDAVHVVRCDECWFRPKGKTYCTELGRHTGDGFYCAFGQRREE